MSDSASSSGASVAPGDGKRSHDKPALLSKAAECAGPLPGVGDVAVCLKAYYRHVAVDDLSAAGPNRLAAVTARHARLAAHRPQGRALVEVRRGGDAVLDPPADASDIVTDDMPFLVDSVTMELANHGLAAKLVVHPQLRVRRDVTGALREIVGQASAGQLKDGGSSHDELAESWTHIEIPPLAVGEDEALAADLRRVLGDVRGAVEDYGRMRARAIALADDVLSPEGEEPGGAGHIGGGNGGADAPAEIAELLRWLADGHFTFLGYREYDLVIGADGMALTAVPGTGLGILRHDRVGPGSFALLPEAVKARALEPQRLIVTKANSRSTVHRPSYLDYVGIKRLSPAGEIVGEYRFLGLYTHAAFSESIKTIPVLRRKLAEVLELSGMAADSHDGKEVAEVLDFYPREELFMTSASDLAEITAGVHVLRERRQTRLFLRTDVYGRYVSCLIYLPRDRYTTKVRLRAQEILQRAFGGASQVDYSVLVGESPVARLHLVVRADRGRQLPDADPAALERAVADAVRSWDDDMTDEMVEAFGPERARELMTQIGPAIPENYKTDVPPSAAITDFARILELRDSDRTIDFDLWESETYVGGVPIEADEHVPDTVKRVWRLTIYRTAGPITLTDVLPRLQHMGVDVVDEHPYEFATAEPFWIYDFGLRRRPVAEAGDGMPQGDLISHQRVREQVEGALAALWDGLIEDDGFNALVLDAQLTWRQVVVLRAYAKYLRQANITFSQDYIESVLRSNAPIARLLMMLFESRFDPTKQDAELERSDALIEEIGGALDNVASLDEDRILRTYLRLIMATLRTNYFSTAFGPVPYLVFKLDAQQVPDLPAPRPQFEMFVYSPRFEGVHLRFARVARGGLRWSDRREDFRTEILGLAKAQEVKNSVIVPSGAKGGFV